MTKFLKFVLLLFICLADYLLYSQKQSVVISVTDPKRNILAGATVQLRNNTDSAIVYGTTNQSGKATLVVKSAGFYTAKISFVGYETLEKTILVSQQYLNFDFRLKESTISLNEVVVAVPKPLIRTEDDKMIIDPEPMAAMSTNVVEVLETTPGLYVDYDGGIYINNATPAVVYINGREQKMSSQDVMSLLRNLPPGSVQRIEVIRTPSTKYDAATSGGIINIVLKKGVKLGRFGTLNTGLNQGVYGNRFAGVSFNNSSEKGEYYINLNYNNNNWLEELNSVRDFTTDTSLTQSALTHKTADQIYVGYGINHNLSENLVLSYDGRVSPSFQKSFAENRNSVGALSGEVLSESSNNIDIKNNSINIQQDFGLVKKFDTLGSELDNKFSYNYNLNETYQDITTEYFSPQGLSHENNSKNIQNRNFLVLQSDLTYCFPNKLKLETGIKSSFQHYDSNGETQAGTNGSQSQNPINNTGFIHKENINAGYFQFSKTLFAGILLKSGFRVEHTYMNGQQKAPADTGFVVNRTDFFPYVYLSRTIFTMFGIELKAYAIYRRSINRPGFHHLNPYIMYIDQFYYETGNPALKPQFTDNIEVNISFEERPVFAIGQYFTRDVFSNVVYRDGVNDKISVMTYDNLGTNKETYFKAMAGIPPGKTYFFAIGAQYNLTEYNGLYENQPLSFTRGSWRFFTFHSLTLSKNTKFMFSGFLMYKGLFNFYELNTFGQVNAGFSQSFMKKKLNVYINMRDIFRTMVTQFELNQGSQHSSGDRYTDNQRFGINIRYNFGLEKKDEKKKLNGFETEE